MLKSSLSPKWYDALTLGERIETARNAGLLPRRPGSGTLADHWKSQAPFGNDRLFARRLAQEGLDEGAFRKVLDLGREELSGAMSETPAWLEEVRDAYEGSPEPKAQVPAVDLDRTQPGQELVELVQPLVKRAHARLRRAMAGLASADSPRLVFDAGRVSSGLLSHWSDRLARMLQRTMILELHAARLEGRLRGVTPQERYRSFVDDLRDPDVAIGILHDYPVLARLVVERLARGVESSLELLARFVADRGALVETFWPERDPGLLVEVLPGAGDPHHGGRSVALLRFESGEGLVYKPRSVKVETGFYDLLDWINQRGLEPRFRNLRLLDRGTYGWVEEIVPYDCETRQEIDRFYERQGGYLALLYLLDATDLHFENVLAAGEHPMLIDLETLFQPSTDVFETRELPVLPGNNAYRTVENVGLLPQEYWALPGQGAGVELSGLAASSEQQGPRLALVPVAENTDEMRMAQRSAPFPEMWNRPRRDGVNVPVTAHTEAVTRGFERVYRLLLEHHDELKGEGGRLASFAGAEVRIVLRQTTLYNMLLGDGFHPDVLQDALEREMLFDRLWLEVERRPALEKLIPAERHDLHQVDIPRFTTRPESCDLWLGPGQRITEFLPEPGLRRVEHKLEQLGERDLARQLWIVGRSLDLLALRDRPLRRASYPVDPKAAPARPRDLLDMAQKAAERLALLALTGREDDATWLICEVQDEKSFTQQPAGPDLYKGLSGITLFLAYHGAVAGDERSTRLARAAWTTAGHQLRSEALCPSSPGAFTGWSGGVYTMLHLSALWREPALLDEAEALVDRQAARGFDQALFDVVDGVAGCLVVLLELDRLRPSGVALEAAIGCGEHLLASARESEAEYGWTTEAMGPRPLLGFSHGAAGMAWALLKLAERTGDVRFREAALKAIAYERGLFSKADQNWPNVREPSPETATDKSIVAWCHGAPGVGLARLGCLSLLEDSQARQEIAVAVRTTLARGFGRNQCLCHGDLGNLDFLLTASRTLADADLRADVDRLAGAVVAGWREHGWLYGLPVGLEPLGLMVGLAGIGYQGLRLAAPELVPSVLLLEPAPGKAWPGGRVRRRSRKASGIDPCQTSVTTPPSTRTP